MLLLQKDFSLHFYSTAISLHLQNLKGVQANHEQDVMQRHCWKPGKQWVRILRKVNVPHSPKMLPSACAGAIYVEYHNSSQLTVSVQFKQLPCYTCSDKPALLVLVYNPHKHEQIYPTIFELISAHPSLVEILFHTTFAIRLFHVPCPRCSCPFFCFHTCSLRLDYISHI